MTKPEAPTNLAGGSPLVRGVGRLADDADPVVGHKTFRDGPHGFRHEPLRASEADAIMASIEAADKRRAELMPTEQDAIRMMFEARQRLMELGWNDATYCPKDGSEFDAIESGSTGIHRCHYSGEWPNGHWWIAGDGDLYPSRPVLYRAGPPKPPRKKLADRKPPNVGIEPPRSGRLE